MTKPQNESKRSDQLHSENVIYKKNSGLLKEATKLFLVGSSDTTGCKMTRKVYKNGNMKKFVNASIFLLPLN